MHLGGGDINLFIFCILYFDGGDINSFVYCILYLGGGDINSFVFCILYFGGGDINLFVFRILYLGGGDISTMSANDMQNETMLEIWAKFRTECRPVTVKLGSKIKAHNIYLKTVNVYAYTSKR